MIDLLALVVARRADGGRGADVVVVGRVGVDQGGSTRQRALGVERRAEHASAERQLERTLDPVVDVAGDAVPQLTGILVQRAGVEDRVTEPNGHDGLLAKTRRARVDAVHEGLEVETLFRVDVPTDDHFRVGCQPVHDVGVVRVVAHDADLRLLRPVVAMQAQAGRRAGAIRSMTALAFLDGHDLPPWRHRRARDGKGLVRALDRHAHGPGSSAVLSSRMAFEGHLTASTGRQRNGQRRRDAVGPVTVGDCADPQRVDGNRHRRPAATLRAGVAVGVGELSRVPANLQEQPADTSARRPCRVGLEVVGGARQRIGHRERHDRIVTWRHGRASRGETPDRDDVVRERRDRRRARGDGPGSGQQEDRGQARTASP